MESIALLFPGQGSQYVGMMKTLYDEFAIVRDTFVEANDILKFDLRKLCFEGRIDELTQTQNVQPALLTASIAAFRVYMQEVGVTPQYSAGHSLGEYCALTCSGAIAFSDALRIVRLRGIYMQESVEKEIGTMIAINGVQKDNVEEVCRIISNDKNVIAIACYNSQEQTVISGTKEAIRLAEEKLSKNGAVFTPLKVCAPFHSILMQHAAIKLNKELIIYKFNQLKWPVISNVTGQPYKDETEIVKNLTNHVVQPVKWHDSMIFLQKAGVTVTIELGPKEVLKNLIKKNFSNIVALSCNKTGDLKDIKSTLSLEMKLNVIENSREVKQQTSRFIDKCLAVVVCTKNYNWNSEEYYKGVITPYRKIKEMQEYLEIEGKEPSIEQMREVLQLLQSIFLTKKVSINEQIERFNEIFDDSGVNNLFLQFLK